MSLSYNGKAHPTVIPLRDFTFQCEDMKEEIPVFKLTVPASNLEGALARVRAMLEVNGLSAERMLVLYHMADMDLTP